MCTMTGGSEQHKTLTGEGKDAKNPPSNGLPVRLEICRVMIHSTPSPKIMTWQASALHVISPFNS